MTLKFLFFTQVYLLSAQARCTALANSMRQSFLFDGSFEPPGLPPLSTIYVPSPPPPPPSPPRPRVPREESDHIFYIEPTSVLLSTYFMGDYEDNPTTSSSELGGLMPLTNLANATRAAALQRITDEKLATTAWATCSAQTADAPLPCRTGDTPSRCLDGARRCGTTNENTAAPFLEIDLLQQWPKNRVHYLFAIEFSLPSTAAYAQLFYESSHEGGGSFYELNVMDESHNPLEIQCKPHYEQSVDHYQDGLVHVQHVCLEALAEDADYAAMQHARFLRLTLMGSHRMIWLDSLVVVLRTPRDLDPSPPPSPGGPPSPPSPVAPPDAPIADINHNCTFFDRKALTPMHVTLAFLEPCGLSRDDCCARSYDHPDTLVFVLSASGCCALYRWSDGPQDPVDAETGYGIATTGTRTVA